MKNASIALDGRLFTIFFILWVIFGMGYMRFVLEQHKALPGEFWVVAVFPMFVYLLYSLAFATVRFIGSGRPPSTD